MKYIDCKEVRDKILDEVRSRNIEDLILAIVQVEGDDASNVYVRNKIKTAESVGIEAHVFNLPNDTKFDIVKGYIKHLNEREDVTGVMLQLPLPDHLKEYEQELLDLIDWRKDVDGLSTASVGRLWGDLPCIAPATPGGIMHLLPEDMSGKDVCIVNRSNLIGKPLTKLLLDRNATVKVCHSKTLCVDLDTARADYVITGVGKAKYFKHYSATTPQTWIDCGINRDEDGKLCGDVDTKDLLEYYDGYDISVTPVPNGVGILTTAQLMLNVVKAYELQKEYK